jgi:hypothetical protein
LSWRSSRRIWSSLTRRESSVGAVSPSWATTPACGSTTCGRERSDAGEASARAGDGPEPLSASGCATAVTAATRATTASTTPPRSTRRSKVRILRISLATTLRTPG